MFAGNFAPKGWALCNGQMLAISNNTALFYLLGTAYGGDGVSTFVLPDLRGRVPLHQGQSAGTSAYVVGQTGGVEQVTLTAAQLPFHQHGARCASAGDRPNPAGAFWGASNAAQYVPGTSGNTNLNPVAIGQAGGGQAHDNMVPYQAVNFIIALQGIFPSQS